MNRLRVCFTVTTALVENPVPPFMIEKPTDPIVSFFTDVTLAVPSTPEPPILRT